MTCSVIGVERYNPQPRFQVHTLKNTAFIPKNQPIFQTITLKNTPLSHFPDKIEEFLESIRF